MESFLPARLAPVKKLCDSEFPHEVSRERFVPLLESETGQHLVLVRYQPYDGERKSEWIFNRANLQDARIVWARDSRDPQTLRQLMAQFSGRKLWLAEPDAKPPRVRPYPDLTFKAP